MNPADVILTLTLVILAFAAGAVWEWRAENRELRTSEPVMLPEIPPTDPMVLCPSCGLMGYHSLDLVPAQAPAPIHSYVDELGDRVDIFTWQSAAGTAAHYRRECVFCQHAWSVPMPKEAS